MDNKLINQYELKQRIEKLRASLQALGGYL